MQQSLAGKADKVVLMPKKEMKKLIQLARDKSPEARSRLLENITEFIVSESIG